MWVRGLKPFLQPGDQLTFVSHPMWVRGLKLKFVNFVRIKETSHPMWVRGLKLVNACTNSVDCCVAPHVGAWIETQLYV